MWVRESYLLSRLLSAIDISNIKLCPSLFWYTRDEVRHNIPLIWCNGPLARYVKLRVAHAPGMPWMFSLQPRVSDPDMYHGMCVSFEVGGGDKVPSIPGACATRKFTYLSRGPWNSIKVYCKRRMPWWTSMNTWCRTYLHGNQMI